MAQDEHSGELRDVAANGMAFIAAGQAIKLIIHVVALAILSRLLGPDEFGVFAMMSPLLALAAILRDGGLTSAVLQRQSITASQLNALFWISVSWGTLVACLFALSAPVAARLYAEPRLAALVLASSAMVLAGSLSIQHMALLNRALRFRALAMIDAGSLALGYLVGGGIAVVTKSYWALWAVACTTTLSVVFASWVACRWRPSRPRMDAEISDLVRVGGNITVSSIFDFLIRSVDNVLIGRFRGGYELGLYDRSYRIVMLPLNFVGTPLERLVLPVLARLCGEEARYRKVYRLALQAPLLTIAPGLVAIMAAPDPVCLLLLGRDWIGAAPMLAWLSLAGALQIVTGSLSPLLVSQGRARELTTLNGASLALACTAFAAGLPSGAVGVAAAYAISEILRTPVAVWWATRKGPVGPAYLGRIVLPFLISAIAAFAILAWLNRQIPVAPFAFLALSVAVAYGATAGSLLCTTSGRECLNEAVRITSQIAAASKSALVGAWRRNASVSSS